MGDAAKSISDRVRTMEQMGTVELPVDIPRTATMAADMVRKSLQAFIEADAELARTILTMDDAVDAMNRAAYKALTKVMEEQSHLAPQALNALMISRSLERVARPRYQHCRGRDLLGAGRRCASPRERERSQKPGVEGSGKRLQELTNAPDRRMIAQLAIRSSSFEEDHSPSVGR